VAKINQIGAVHFWDENHWDVVPACGINRDACAQHLLFAAGHIIDRTALSSIKVLAWMSITISAGRPSIRARAGLLALLMG
jgi:hypothetical protein